MSSIRLAVVCLVVCALSVSFAPLLAASATEVVPASAPHGAHAIVAGSGLDAASTVVRFTAAGGGTATAAIVSQSPSTIEVVVPLNAVSGDVRVSSGAGDIGTFSFTLLPDPGWLKVETLVASDKGHDVLKQPSGVAASPSGVVYVADTMHLMLAAPCRSETPRYDEANVVAYAKAIDVAELDANLQSQPLDKWLRLGPARVEKLDWRMSDCDLKPDYREPPAGHPLCVRLSYRRGGISGWAIITVGTTRKGDRETSP